ncbi:MAG: heparinase II/III family protein, partial [Candidatus Omnitrophica bacterium]|nr:heparinase II/III family protein [Candidatus Omnitrophota bacterium]
ADFSSGKHTLPIGTEIEAAVVLSQFGVVSADRSYSLNLDGFSLTGSRPNRFVGVEPESTWLDPFQKSILHRHYRPGETISLTVELATVVESDPLGDVSVSIVDGNGNTVAKTSLEGEESWSNDSIYRLKESDPPGRWRARVNAVTESGNRIQNDLEFLVPIASVIDSHPRLLFTKQEVADRAEERSNSELQEIFDKARTVAKECITGATPGDYPEFNEVNDEYLGGGDFSPHWPDFMTWRNGLLSSVPARDGAFLYSLADDKEAGDAAKDLLLHVCNFSEWNHPWMKARGTYMYYPMGYTAYRAALSFDLLYPLLSEVEREQVAEGLFELGIEPCYLGEVVDNHIPSNISNHLGVSCTGGLLAAISLLGENPDNRYMEPHLSGILAKLEAHIHAAYLPDKSYAETFGYYHMDADMVSKAAAALEKNFGIDLTTTTHFKDAWIYPHYVSTPDGQNCLDMGDGSGNWGKNGKTSLLWIAQRLRDPMAWDRYLWSTGPEMYTEFPIEFYDYLWRPIDLQPESANSLPPSRLFEERGMAVFRSGWESEDLRLLYKAGPHTNHHHLDQGNFVLQYGGETLVDEGGYAKYYENKYYHS